MDANDGNDGPILVIGASGFVGRRLVKRLLEHRYLVRCFVRDPTKVADLEGATGCEIVKGDMTDRATVAGATRGARAVYLAVHTLSRQSGSPTGKRFMEVERDGIENVIAAMRANGIKRVIYLTAIGSDPSAKSEWLRERWATEQLLIDSGLDATVIQPGQIVGRGGRGFEMILANARKRVAVLFGNGRNRLRSVAVNDLVRYMTDVLDAPQAYGRRLAVGNDDVLSVREMIDAAAEVMGRHHPIKIPVPAGALRMMSSTIERMAKMPAGAMAGMIDSLGIDLIGDPHPISKIVPFVPLSYKQAVQTELE